MRRTSYFSSIAMTLFLTVAACGGDDNAPAGPGAGGSGGTTTTGSGGGGTTGAGGSKGTGGAADSSPDVIVDPRFSFFVTSTGSDTNGGDLGGLSGADQKCQMLAAAVGAGSKTWHAYLSVSVGPDGGGAVNARDRIGSGPWHNVKGDLIANDLESLHEEIDGGDGGVMNGINAATGIDEHGNAVPAMANPEAGVRNEHDILTGSQPDGRAYPASGPNYDCAGWTSNQAAPPAVPADAASEGGEAGLLDGALADAGPPGPVARVGHVNRMGTAPPPNNNASWNSVHTTPGCAQADIRRVGGAGRTYCFALSGTQSDSGSTQSDSAPE